MPFPEGAKVRKGDLLVRIKPDVYQSQVDQQEANLVAARASSVQARAQLAKTQEDFKRAQDLFGKKLLSDADFTAARTFPVTSSVDSRRRKSSPGQGRSSARVRA